MDLTTILVITTMVQCHLLFLTTLEADTTKIRMVVALISDDMIITDEEVTCTPLVVHDMAAITTTNMEIMITAKGVIKRDMAEGLGLTTLLRPESTM